MAKYRGILFDLGGTLFEHQDTSSAQANLKHFASRTGIHVPPMQLFSTFRRVRAEVETEFSRRTFYLHRELVKTSIERLAAEFGQTATAQAATEYCDRQRQAVTDGLRLRDDCIRTLAELQRQGRYLAIVSNIDNDYLDPLLERTGLTSYFHDCLSSESARSCKPDTAFFQQAIARSGHRVDELLYVGDSLRHDVVGAKAVDMDVAWLAEAGDPGVPSCSSEQLAPDYRIGRLSELLTLA